MTKKFVSLFLALVMCLSLAAPAFAAAETDKDSFPITSKENVDNVPQDTPQEIIDRYYTMTTEEIDEILTQHTKTSQNTYEALAAPKNMTEEINRMAVRATETAGPYSNIWIIPARYLKIVLDNIYNSPGGYLYTTYYSGSDCFLFSDGTTNVYVTADTFFHTHNVTIYPSDTSVSNTLTSYINTENTDGVCSAYYSSTVDNYSSIYQWKIAQIASQVFPHGTDEQNIKSTILNTVYFTATTNYLSVYNVNQPISYQPELTLEMTDGGSNNDYFNSFYIKGQGLENSTSDIGSLVSFGYNASRIFSPNFSIIMLKDLISPLSCLIQPDKNIPSGYFINSVVVSNPATFKWSRKCTMPSPRVLAQRNHTFEMQIGLAVANSKAKYKVTIKYNF